MAVGTLTLFSKNKADFRLNDLPGVTLKMALVSSLWTPDSSVTGNSVWADVSAYEIAPGNGYTSGGVTLLSATVTAIANGYKFSTANPNWAASGGSIPAWRYAVMYVSGTFWGKSSPLVGYLLGDTTPANVPATDSGSGFTITCPASGWYTAT
jgi:hypothetical protein